MVDRRIEFVSQPTMVIDLDLAWPLDLYHLERDGCFWTRTDTMDRNPRDFVPVRMLGRHQSPASVINGH